VGERQGRGIAGGGGGMGKKEGGGKKEGSVGGGKVLKSKIKGGKEGIGMEGNGRWEQVWEECKGGWRGKRRKGGRSVKVGEGKGGGYIGEGRRGVGGGDDGMS